MRHLTEAELVDLVDGALAPSRHAHLEVCNTCRTAEAELRKMLAQAGDVQIPEPSPLFWEHFSARVHEGVRHAEAGEPARWFGWFGNPAFVSSGKWAIAGAVLTLVLVAAVWRASAPAPGRVAPTTTASVSTAGSNSEPGLIPDSLIPGSLIPGSLIDDAFDPDTDEAWALVRTVADDLSWDDAAVEGVGVRPGSAERAMMTLSGDERSELVRLLQAETKQPGA
jgi:hypothetical protein